MVVQFAERAYEQCRSQHIQQGSIDPTFIIEAGNDGFADEELYERGQLFGLTIDASNEETKDSGMQVVHEWVRKLSAQKVLLYCEAWSWEIPDDLQVTDEEYERIKAQAHRREIISVGLFTPDNGWHTSAEIHRSKDGNFSLPDHIPTLVYQELTLQREGRFYPYD
ncbi:MAG: hypothetical protein H7Y37_18250 [Anaerolineae bacterium]|nr:hypothetical protein [Gloeobacterales cyanobacterium ES-bin-313]